MGAAIDDEEVTKNPQDILDDLTNWGTLKSDFGSAIEEEVVDFYNLFNPKDNIFEPNLIPAFQIYSSFEGDWHWDIMIHKYIHIISFYLKIMIK
jgi:hypothetical protein